jgi:hypothetical protein
LRDATLPEITLLCLERLTRALQLIAALERAGLVPPGGGLVDPDG